MPCNIPEHEHVWPAEGELIIEKCEQFCGYCDLPQDDEDNAWVYAWFLRRHVNSCHTKPGCDHENVTVSKGW